MSATTKKKHVTKEVLEDYPLPEGNQQIVKVTAAKGNNLHEVVSANGETFLVSMPTKFRKHVWIKRGDYIMVEPIGEGDKVKAEITHILFKEQIKNIRENGLWPESFSANVSQQQGIPSDLLPPSDDEDEDREDNLKELVHNLNRVQVTDLESESEDSCSEEEEDDEEGSQEVLSSDSPPSKQTNKSINDNVSSNTS